MALRPSALVSAPVFLVSLVWAVLAHFSDIANNRIDHVGLRLLLLLLVQLVFFAFPVFTWRVVCPRVDARRWIALLIVSVVLGAAVRGAVFGFLLYSTGLSQVPGYAFRILTSVTNMATVTILLWFVVSEVRSLQQRRRQLLGDRDQLIQLQEKAQGSLEQLGDRATEEIRGVVLQSLGTHAPESSEDLLLRLKVTIDEVIRPLSEQLASQGVPWAPPATQLPEVRVNWLAALRDGLSPVRIHPLVVTLALIWLGLPVHAVQYGPAYAIYLVGTGIVGFPAFWATRRAAMKLTEHRGPALRIPAFIVAVILGGLAMGLSSLIYMRGQEQPFTFVIMVPIFALLVSALLAVAEAARDQSLAIEADLEATTADLRWTLARTREQHRQQERSLAHALHGRVQASLASALVRLDRAIAQGDDRPDLLDELQHDVMAAVGTLDFRSEAPEPLDQVIALTRRTWAGASDITSTVTDDARKALESDRLCAFAVNDLIPELAFNSFRHGKATNIDVLLSVCDQRTLELVVTDDGRSDGQELRRGMGSNLLDEASISWTRARINDRTVTACLLPVLPPHTE